MSDVKSCVLDNKIDSKIVEVVNDMACPSIM